MEESFGHVLINSTREHTKEILFGYVTEIRSDNWNGHEYPHLYKIVERWYPHPEAPEEMSIQILEKVPIKISSVHKPELWVFHYNQTSISNLIKLLKLED